MSAELDCMLKDSLTAAVLKTRRAEMYGPNVGAKAALQGTAFAANDTKDDGDSGIKLIEVFRFLKAERVDSGGSRPIDEEVDGFDSAIDVDMAIVSADCEEDKLDRVPAATAWERAVAPRSTEGNDDLDFSGFARLFQFLDIPLPDRTIKEMYAFADEDNSGSTSPMEFATAWDSLKASTTIAVERELGLSDTDVVIALVCISGIIGLTTAFIVYVYAIWASSRAFNSIFTTILLGGSGFSVSDRRSILGTKFLNDPAGMKRFVRTTVVAELSYLANN